MLRRRVCSVDALPPPGQMRGFSVAGFTDPVLVANVGGELFATASACPHEHVSLLGGELRGGRVVCPGHAYEFDLATGACAHDRALSLVRFRTVVENGALYIELA
ncbi:MAG: Rieske (2Fe-2S) protein [Deltaproteobacteria bacterium]|nr:MAG: Rieske (2Fe-2S) protein [Deltaproteobacteria bacterium]